TNPPWLQVLAAVIVGVLMLLSVILTLTTLLPGVDVVTLAAVGGVVLAVVLLVMGVMALRSRPGAASARVPPRGVPKERWTMPPAALLSRPELSSRRHVALLALGAYMVIALVMLIVKSVGLAGG